MIAALAVALGSVAQAVTGIGFSLVCAPVLIATLGARDGVRTALALSIVINLLVLAGHHRRIIWSRVVLLLVPAVVITPLVAFAVRHLDARWLTLAAGVLTIASAVALGIGVRWGRASGAGGGVVAGSVSGAMNVVGSIGGPAVAIYAVNAGWPAITTRPTLQVYFLLTNIAALVALGGPHLHASDSWLLAGMAGGWLAGRVIASHVDEARATTAILFVAGAGGAVAIARAVASLA